MCMTAREDTTNAREMKVKKERESGFYLYSYTIFSDITNDVAPLKNLLSLNIHGILLKMVYYERRGE